MVTLVACSAPIPGSDNLLVAGNQAVAGPGVQGGNSTSAGNGQIDNPLPASPTAPWIERMEPDNGGPGVEVTLTGKNLTPPGVAVYFGSLKATTVVAQEDGSLKAVVPEGARTGNLAVVRGQERAVRWFKVLARLNVNIMRPLPAPIGLAMPVSVSAQDTEGNTVSKPFYTLSIDPGDAADVVSPTSVVPRREIVFKVQAFSGRIQAITLAPGCSNGFSLTNFAGDGEPLPFVVSKPVLTQGSTESNNFAEVGPANTAHIEKPWGIVAFSHPRSGDGILIADTIGNRVRFVPLNGSAITTVVGGGLTPAATDSQLARTIELLEPAGLAVGKDFDGKEIVAIVERGRHRILRWEPESDLVEVIAGRGAATTTRNGTDSVVATPEDLGDRNDAKKVCGEPTKATFFDPSGVAMVFLGNKRAAFIVADTNNHRVRKFVRLPPNEALNEAKNRGCTVAPGLVVTGEITTILGNGKSGNDISSSDPASSSVNAPTAVATHPDGVAQNYKFIFIADTNNNRVLEMAGALDAALATISVRVAAPPEGSPLAPLSHPYGLFLHPGTKDLLITDTGRNRILRYRQAGNHLRDVATCSLSASPSNGLVWPRGITSRDTSATGLPFPAFISDFHSNQVRLLDAPND